jgi:hypothetical protein
MTPERLKDDYFFWLYDLVCNDEYNENNTHYKLFSELDSIEFLYSMPIDESRAKDGVELRYRFGRERDYHGSIIQAYLDVRPCSVLEMMIALSLRMEDAIMADSHYGNRVSQWFWEMIVSLGIGKQNDQEFDKEFVDEKVYSFMNHDYYSNGEGGLFTVCHSPKDMRKMDIWYQMCEYLNEVLSSSD